MKKIAKALLLVGTCLFLSSCVMVNVNSGYHYDNEGRYSFGNATIPGTVNSIDIDWVAGNVTFVTTEEAEVSIYERNSDSFADRKKVHYWYDDEYRELKIKFCAPMKTVEFNEERKDLTIYIPSSYTSLIVSGNVVSADIISSVSCVRNWDIDSVSGCVDITNGNNVERVDFNSVSGDFNIVCNSLYSFESDTTSGDVYITTNDANEMEFDSVSGDVEISIPSTLGFYVDYSALGKKFSSNVPVQIDGSECWYGDCKLKIEFDSVSGNITVDVR